MNTATLVRRGTARRLGLGHPYRHYPQRWAMGVDRIPDVHLEWSTTFPATGPEWWLGETRRG